MKLFLAVNIMTEHSEQRLLCREPAVRVVRQALSRQSRACVESMDVICSVDGLKAEQGQAWRHPSILHPCSFTLPTSVVSHTTLEIDIAMFSICVVCLFARMQVRFLKVSEF